MFRKKLPCVFLAIMIAVCVLLPAKNTLATMISTPALISAEMNAGETYEFTNNSNEDKSIQWVSQPGSVSFVTYNEDGTSSSSSISYSTSIHSRIPVPANGKIIITRNGNDENPLPTGGDYSAFTMKKSEHPAFLISSMNSGETYEFINSSDESRSIQWVTQPGSVSFVTYNEDGTSSSSSISYSTSIHSRIPVPANGKIIITLADNVKNPLTVGGDYDAFGNLQHVDADGIGSNDSNQPLGITDATVSAADSATEEILLQRGMTYRFTKNSVGNDCAIVLSNADGKSFQYESIHYSTSKSEWVHKADSVPLLFAYGTNLPDVAYYTMLDSDVILEYNVMDVARVDRSEIPCDLSQLNCACEVMAMETVSTGNDVSFSAILSPLTCDTIVAASYGTNHYNKLDLFMDSYDSTSTTYYEGVCIYENGVCSGKNHQGKGHHTEGVEVIAVADGTLMWFGTGKEGAIKIKHTDTTLITGNGGTRTEHDIWYSSYMHIVPRAGLKKTVRAGDVLGTVAVYGQQGANHGAHLHFELRDKNDTLISPALVLFSNPFTWDDSTKGRVDGR